MSDSQTHAAAQALAALASRLGALPYRSAGDGARSLLNTLKAASLQGAGQNEAQATAALDLWAAGAIPQPEWADVAACVSGVAPAYAGGPFAHLWGHHERLLPRWDIERRQAWARLQPQLQEAYA